ncbi:hypothetical protein PLESTB_000839000 [Pleodorina starrii]|uniref:CCDC81 HU domain-containing protein n=1 Tax=Pleodorina starrii TaxID=330485 RepID=A0A9W6BLK6_9CHLO|nr:hypothetical protein PLESTB_000839000 [Pleodorina starrii]
MLRPIFVPSDAYLRAHLLHTGSGVTRASSVGTSELEPCEEYSAMKIAIKHSCSLNKDVVSSCTRHLLQHLGEALRSGRPLSLDLGVGVLTGRDRCLAFRFHSQYLAHWPAAAAAAALAAERSVAAAAAALPPPQERRLAKSEGGRAGLYDGKAPAPRSGSAGGFINACEGDVAGDPDTERQLQAAGDVLRPGSPGRRGYFTGHPDNAQLQQEGEHGAGQQRLSPGRGKDSEQRQPGRAAAAPPPSPARSRPGWGVRVPPPPPSPGRRAATAAAPHSPGPHNSTGAVYGALDAPASPGDHYRSSANPHQHQLSYESSDGMPHSPRRSANGGGGGDVGSGGAEAMDAAMPVGRALHLATRTPRRRPSSPGPAPHHPPSNSYSKSPHGRAVHSNSEGGASVAQGARPSSAPRCRPLTVTVSAGGAAASAETAALGRWAQPASPRQDGGGAAGAARPPWGSGHGARGRSASAAGAGSAVRPSSAPRLRHGAAATAAAASVGAEQVDVGAVMTTDGEMQQGPRAAWAAAGGESGVGGGVAAGADVRQLWSPDSNLAAARRGPSAAAGASSVRRLFGVGEPQARHSNLPQQQQRQQRQPEQRLMQQSQPRRQQQPCATANYQRNASTVEPDDGHDNDDGAVFDQQKQPPSSHQSQQHPRNAGQCQEKQPLPQEEQQLRHGARKPLFLTPQKDAARPRPAAAAAVGPGRPAGRSLLRSPSGDNGIGGGGGQQRPAAAREPRVGSFGGEEPPDHSPQLRRDQCSKQPIPGSPAFSRREPAPATVAAAAGGGGGGSRPHRTLVRALSPRTETQQLNMRYGTPTRAGGGQAAAASSAAGTAVLLDCSPRGATEQGGGRMADVGRGAGGSGPKDTAGRAVARVLGDGRDGARTPARFNLIGICGAAAFGSPAAPTAAAAAVAAAGWNCDAPLTAGARQTEAAPGLLPGSASRQGVGRCLLPPRDGLSVAAAAAGDGEAVARGPQPLQSTGAPARRRQSSPDAGLRWGASCSSSDGSLVLTGRSRGEESCRASAISGGTATAASMAFSFRNGSGDGGSGGGAGGDLGSSSCCVAPSIDNLDLGYPLPMYDSSIDGGRSSGGGGSGPGSITAAVQAALGRQRRSGGGDGGGGPDLLRQPELQQLVNLNLGTSPRGADRYGERYGDAFPVPMIISEEDLPRPAWGAASGVPRQPEPWLLCGSDSASSSAAAGPPAAAGGLGEAALAEPREEEVGSPLEPVVVACSAASSAEICWSARSARQGYGADADAFVVAGAAQRYRRACGGAPAGSEELGGASLAGEGRRGAAVRASPSGSEEDVDEDRHLGDGSAGVRAGAAFDEGRGYVGGQLVDGAAGRGRSGFGSDESDSDVSGAGQRRRRGLDAAASGPQPLERGGARITGGASRGAARGYA